MRLPAHLHISPESCKRLMPVLFSEVEALQKLSESRRVDAAVAMCIAELFRVALERAETGASIEEEDDSKTEQTQAPALWHCLAEALLGGRLERHPYWRALSKSFPLSEVLAPSPEADYVRMMSGDIFAVYHCMAENLSAEALHPAMTVGLFWQARLGLLTRQFETPHGLALIPVCDMFNHSAKPSAMQVWTKGDDAFNIQALRAIS